MCVKHPHFTHIFSSFHVFSIFNHRKHHIPPLYLLNQSRCLQLRLLSESILPNVHDDLTVPTPKKNRTGPHDNQSVDVFRPLNETPPKKKKCNEKCIEEYFCTRCSHEEKLNGNWKVLELNTVVCYCVRYQAEKINRNTNLSLSSST